MKCLFLKISLGNVTGKKNYRYKKKSNAILHFLILKS